MPTGTSPATIVDIQPLWSNLSSGGAGACVYSYDPNRSVFYLDGSGNISFQENGSGVGTKWASASALRGAPAIAHWGPYRYDVFGYGSTSPTHLRRAYESGYPGSGDTATGGDDWGLPPLGSTFVTSAGGRPAGPTVASWGASRLDVFATVVTSSGTSAILRRAWDNGADSGWLDQVGIPSGAGAPVSAPAAVSPVYGWIELYVLMADGNVYRSFCDAPSCALEGATCCTASNSFSAWASIGHPTSETLVGSPAAAAWGATYGNDNGGSPGRSRCRRPRGTSGSA
jgi:hypothetical protein